MFPMTAARRFGDCVECMAITTRLWINPDDSSYLINGNDGGINMSYDGGKNWRLFTDQIPAVQFFNVMYDMDTPFHVYGSIQDHGSMRGEVAIRSTGTEPVKCDPWNGKRAPGGEGQQSRD